MKVSKLQASDNREAMLHAAAAQVRGRGLAQLSVAEVAKAAGLTHGALYSHFGSREALQAEAVRRAFADTRAGFAETTPERFLDAYLSARHRDGAEQGCPAAALVTEVQRQSDAVQAAFNEGMRKFVDQVETTMGLSGTEGGRDRALFTLAAMAGGVAISRALRGSHEAASDDVLRAVHAELRRLLANWTAQATAVAPDGDALSVRRPPRSETSKSKSSRNGDRKKTSKTPSA